MIREYVETLASYSEEQWVRYAFGREPLAHKLTKAKHREFYEGATQCGLEQAAILRGEWGEAGVRELAGKMNVRLKVDTTITDGMFTTFATYSMKDGITIYADNARLTDELILQYGFEELTGGVKTEELLLAHELFHHVENHTPDLYILKKHILLFKLGWFEHRSRLFCLGEIAAMAFAKELTGLPCSPYLFDVLMLYPKNPQRAGQQFAMMQNIAAK